MYKPTCEKTSCSDVPEKLDANNYGTWDCSQGGDCFYIAQDDTDHYCDGHAMCTQDMMGGVKWEYYVKPTCESNSCDLHGPDKRDNKLRGYWECTGNEFGVDVCDYMPYDPSMYACQGYYACELNMKGKVDWVEHHKPKCFDNQLTNLG